MSLKVISPSLPAKTLLDPKACHLLLGTRIGSLPVSLFYFQMNAFLKGPHPALPREVAEIPIRLLEHNLDKRRRREHTDLLPIDADVVFEYDAATKHTRMDYKVYYQNPGLERPSNQQRVVMHISITEGDGLRRSVSVPLQALMSGYGDVTEGHQGYAHSIYFIGAEEESIEQWYYIGVTSRNWLERMEEHMNEIRSGSGKRFHAAWRAYAGDTRVMLGSELIVLNHSFVNVMNWEEDQVDKHMAQGP